MNEALLTDMRFHRLLLAYDTDLARRARTCRCVRCGGVLHSARYRRKPRGLPAGLGEEYRQRFSFCCAVRECRRRKTAAHFALGESYLGTLRPGGVAWAQAPSLPQRLSLAEAADRGVRRQGR